MKNYSSYRDLYSLARILSREFTRDEYKSFLIENEFIRSDILEEPYGRFSRILVKEVFIRETLFLLTDEKFPEFIVLLQSEGKLPKLSDNDVQKESQKRNLQAKYKKLKKLARFMSKF